MERTGANARGQAFIDPNALGSFIFGPDDRRQEQAVFNDLARAREALVNALRMPKGTI